MKRYNPVIEARKAQKERDERKTEICIQMCFDAATLAANEVLGLGKGRYLAFANAFRDKINGIGSLIHEDAKDDKDITYSRAKIDEAIKPIAGDAFMEWDERYGDKRKEDGNA